MLAAAIRLSIFFVLMPAILFGSAGRWDWPMAWAFLGVYLGLIVVAFPLVDPDLIKERSRIGPGVKRWDLVLVSLIMFLLYPGTLAVAGLDVGRFGWSRPIPGGLQVGALALFVLGAGLGLWAMVRNTFCSTFVRIQSDRGHAVVSEGPYACVRHPVYAGAILAAVALPIALGSLWALIPGSLAAALLILRTAWEDRTLQKELSGYAEYASGVRWRLVPGIW